MAIDTHDVKQNNVMLQTTEKFLNYYLTLKEDDLQQRIEFIIEMARSSMKHSNCLSSH